jgi:hypothetical protein
LYACQNDVTTPTNVVGFCLIDQMLTDDGGAPAPLGNPELVAECPSNERRLLRFVGAETPAAGSLIFLGCTSP